MKPTDKQIKLDWNKLVGFTQAKVPIGNPTAKRTKAMVGAKSMLGAKPGSPNA